MSACCSFFKCDANMDTNTRTHTRTDLGRRYNFVSITRSYFRGAHGSLLVFNVGDRDSFDACFALGGQSRRLVPEAPIVCCGTTGGGEDEDLPRVVTEAEARARCEEFGVEYYEVNLDSSDGGAETVFTALVRAILRVRRNPEGPRPCAAPQNQHENENENDNENR